MQGRRDLLNGIQGERMDVGAKVDDCLLTPQGSSRVMQCAGLAELSSKNHASELQGETNPLPKFVT